MRATRVLPLLAVLVCALPTSARSESSPRPVGEGLEVRLEPGWALWSLDGERIAGQVGLESGNVQPLFVDATENAFALALRLGYNVLGHATVAVDLVGTGWDLGSNQRGGAGFVAGTVSWHPAALLESLEVLEAGRPWDASLFFGAGYGVVGEDRALDGLHLALGVRGEYFPKPWLSVGATLRYLPLMFGRYVIDWNGGTDIDLPQRSGGSLFMPSLTVAVHAPVGG